ncbi:MAG TPA: NAD(P)H-dependent oxidoreductase subunit E [Methylomusa anaerophila]|uniref:NADP-reducing hydrogenase subunit HndA n=1 Tax=Methylomusa anaerophila TaxID=1930071 RepID=A0A348ALV5_9FIRM|nr:NAD(P)H-dependent oxidoreductase subunit E [Methylomusa anaerophila]BBB92053.1 NADP-reducing hydrogenase subunit HndA [Methylomusa anaerophila]HML87935.1 NAD(P)H-dependent oxidoreductase subunit E [Methylomusa anaerophila]
MSTAKSSADFTATREIMRKYPREQRYTLAILQDIQREYSYIPKESLTLLSEYLAAPLSKLYSMSTFYKALSLKPKGEHIVKICDGTACHIRSSMVIADEIEKLIHIKPGETTDDGRFSLETVNCLGACAIAPVMVINETYYGKVTPAAVKEILSEYGGLTGGRE